MTEKPGYLALEAPIGRLDFWLGKLALAAVVILVDLAAIRLGASRPMVVFITQALALAGFTFLAAKRGVDRGRSVTTTLAYILALTIANLALVAAQRFGLTRIAAGASAVTMLGIALLLVDLGVMGRPVGRRPATIEPTQPWRGGFKPGGAVPT